MAATFLVPVTCAAHISPSITSLGADPSPSVSLSRASLASPFAPLSSSSRTQGLALLGGRGGSQSLGWELQEWGSGTGRGGRREFTASAGRKKREPYVEPTFVFDMPNVPGLPPITAKPTQPQSAQQAEQQKLQQQSLQQQVDQEGKGGAGQREAEPTSKGRLADTSGAEPRYTDGIPTPPEPRPIPPSLASEPSGSSPGIPPNPNGDAQGTPPLRPPSVNRPSSSISARSPSRPSLAFQEAAAATANPLPALSSFAAGADAPGTPSIGALRARGGMQVPANHKSGESPRGP